MQDNYNKMLDTVMSFISSKLGVDKSQLTEETKIEDDVGISGLDTLTFYEEFFTEFSIINSQDFDAEQYVTSENLEIGLVLKSIFSKVARQRLKTKNNTIKHLTNVALTRIWKEDPN